MNIIDGKEISNQIKQKLSLQCSQMLESGLQAGLAVVLVGEDKASQTYVNSKQKACEKVGIYSQVYRLEEKTSQEELLALIEKLNKDEKIHGILVQLPLPKHIDENTIIDAISHEKDVDGFGAANLGLLGQNRECFIPCTPLGIMKLFEAYNIDVTGKNAVVIGVSHIVGKPMIDLLINKRATVTACHSKTQDLAKFTKQADIIVIAVGKPKMLKADMVKKDAIIIDVGINRLDDGKLVGDADFEDLVKKCSFITPVPGGVGPMTIAMLLENTIKACKKVRSC